VSSRRAIEHAHRMNPQLDDSRSGKPVRVQIPFDFSRLCSRRPTTYGAAVPRTRWTRQCRVPTAAEGIRRDSLRWRTASAFSTRHLDPRFVREQPRFVACVDDRTTVGSDPSTGSRRVIVRWQLYKSANGATRHVESSVGRGTPRRSP
jgi:hypothetical protein